MLKHKDQLAPRLRLAMVSSSLRLGGAEKQTVYMARALFEAGVDVRFFYLGTGGYYETVLQQKRIPLQQIYTAGRPWHILTGLVRALSRMRPDIVLVSQFGDLVYGIPAGRFCRALTLGGIRSDGLYELSYHGRLSSCLFRMADGLIANSDRARQNVASRGIGTRKIEVLPNVVDLLDFDWRHSQPLAISLPGDRIVAAAVGSLHSCKRFDRFIDALALARRRESTLAGVIAGADHGAKTELQKRATALGLKGDDLTFVGECDQVPALLARSAFLVLTSDYEGFPNVVLEAMAARLPVITTPAGDARLIVRHGTTGYVVEMDDVQGLAHFMVQLAQSPDLRKQFGVAGRTRVEVEYSYDRLADQLMAVFHAFAARAGCTALREQLNQRNPFLCEPCPA